MSTDKNDDAQRQALIEGFINMSRIEGEKEANVHMADLAYQDEDEFNSDDKSADDLKYEIKENSNVYKSAFHVFKANVGTGVFMLPTFYPDAGYILGVILAIAIGCAVVDCTHLLLRVKIMIDRRDCTTYSQVCRFVCGPILAWVLFTALLLTQFGFCLMYSQLFSASMDELAKFSDKAHYLWVSLMLIICFPMTCFSDNLSLLAIASIIATISVAYALLCCIVDDCQVLAADGVSKTVTAAGRNYPLGWFKNLANNMMSLEGIAIILPVHASCKDKKKVPLMVTCVIFTVVVLYLLFGLLGYLAHGTDQTTSIIANMPYNAWGTSIRAFFIINVVLSYPLQFMSAQQQVDMVFKCKPRSWIGLGMRLFFNLIVWALAMALPSSAVNYVVSFIGAIPSCCMVLLLPSLLTMQVEYAVAHPDENRSSGHYWKVLAFGGESFSMRRFCSFRRARCYAYLIAGLLIMIVGTIGIIMDIVADNQS